MASFSCSGSQSPKPPHRVTCLHQAEGQHSRAGPYLSNQASAFGQYSEQRSRGYTRLHGQSCWATLIRSAAEQIATICVGLRRGLGRQRPTLNARRIGLRSAQCERAAMHRVRRLAAVSAGLQKARSNRLPTAVAVRSPPFEARPSPRPRSRATREVTFRVDQVLRSHKCSELIFRSTWA